jgi:class 3 adenylate cyclase
MPAAQPLSRSGRRQPFVASLDRDSVGGYRASDTCRARHNNLRERERHSVVVSGRREASADEPRTGNDDPFVDGVDEVGPGEVFEIPPGHDAWVVGDEPWVSVDFEAMRTYGKQRNEQAERILASIVMTDIVDSTRIAADLGATAWRDLVAEHNRKASLAIDCHRGRLVKTTGDGVLAQFDGAERAVRGAAAIRDAAQTLGLPIRAGIHTGELQVTSDDVRGIAVHTAARIMGAAGPGEILLSATVIEIIEGSGMTFDDAGIHELKGLPGRRQLYRLATLDPT